MRLMDTRRPPKGFATHGMPHGGQCRLLDVLRATSCPTYWCVDVLLLGAIAQLVILAYCVAQRALQRCQFPVAFTASAAKVVGIPVIAQEIPQLGVQEVRLHDETPLTAVRCIVHRTFWYGRAFAAVCISGKACSEEARVRTHRRRAT